MLNSFRNLPPRHRSAVLRWTFIGTLGCLLFSLSFDAALRFAAHPSIHEIIAVVVLPILLAAPLFAFCTIKMAELSIANRKLKELASTDALTGCLSRGAFSSMVDAWLSRAVGASGKHGALLVVDADHFKRINDRFGHDQGDAALKLIASVVAGSLRAGDLFGRMGGEEFGVFLPGADAAAAGEVAERLRQSVSAARFEPYGRTCRLSVSVGCVPFPEPVCFTELFKIADEHLYEAKRGGRNRVVTAPFPAVPASAGRAARVA